MCDMLDQMAHFHLEKCIRAGLCGVFSGAGGVRVQVAGLLGADLEFGDFEGVVGSYL
ncbi:hypothetical protein D3C84_539720 [compost metagenome]